MRELLRSMAPGVPLECLLARVRGRKAFLVSDWDRVLLASEPLSALAAAPWRPGVRFPDEVLARLALQQEYLWTFGQLEESLRVVFTPFFWLFEVKALAIGLRDLAGGRQADESLLRGSLLNDALRTMLQTSVGISDALERLSAILSPHEGRFSRLPDIYRQGGGGALEAALYDFSLEWFVGTSHHPLMGRYIALLIDSRNLLATAKQVHWRMVSPPRLLRGGTLRISDMEGLFARRDSAGIALLAARLGGRGRGAGQQDEMERILMESQGEVLRRMAHEPDGVGAILEYLWLCGVEARNIGLLSQMAIAGIDAVSRELHT